MTKTIPIPAKMHPLPPLLKWSQVVSLLRHWNLGGFRYANDLREVGLIRSCNDFPHGQRARYRTECILKLYPQEA